MTKTEKLIFKALIAILDTAKTIPLGKYTEKYENTRNKYLETTSKMLESNLFEEEQNDFIHDMEKQGFI